VCVCKHAWVSVCLMHSLNLVSYEHQNEGDILPFHMSSYPPVQQNNLKQCILLSTKTVLFDRILPFNEQHTVTHIP